MTLVFKIFYYFVVIIIISLSIDFFDLKLLFSNRQTLNNKNIWKIINKSYKKVKYNSSKITA